MRRVHSGGNTITRVLRRIYVHGYKCLQDFELELQETVLLLGANGVGKTAVLDVVHGLRKLLSAEVKIANQDAFHPSTLTRGQDDIQQVFEIDVEVGEESFRYRLEIEHSDGGRHSRVTRESLTAGPTMLFECEMGDVQLYRDDGSEGPAFRADWTESALARVVAQPTNTRLTAFKDAMRATVVCDIRPALLRAESTARANSSVATRRTTWTGTAMPCRRIPLPPWLTSRPCERSSPGSTTSTSSGPARTAER